MSYIRKMGKNWQCLIRIQHHPKLSKTFKKHEDAKRWRNETELKIRREDGGIAKIKFPSFRGISLRYLNEVSIHKNVAVTNAIQLIHSVMSIGAHI